MTALDIFEKVNLRVQMAQRPFFHFLNDTIDELSVKYLAIPKLVFTDGMKKEVKALVDEVGVLDAYLPAIVDNILFLAGADSSGAAKSEFLRKAEAAYLMYWNQEAKGRRIKKGSREANALWE